MGDINDFKAGEENPTTVSTCSLIPRVETADTLKAKREMRHRGTVCSSDEELASFSTAAPPLTQLPLENIVHSKGIALGQLARWVGNAATVLHSRQ